ncbi:MAG: sulfatase-like hydrolase/transferase [Planctomycetes bacterium]|nr:sulfatase-like hydrolase/transferase [Planctomycetota bacterium]
MAPLGTISGEPPRDLVILVLDALPAHELSSYGYERPTTPKLDALAQRGVRFEHALASASYTLASTASLFTGLTPRAHGCTDETGQALGADHETLAERLGQFGFRTAAFSLNPQVSRETGFDQGFDTFEYLPREDFTYNTLPAGFLETVRTSWVEAADSRRFLYVHLLPPHVPYSPPPPFDQLFGASEVDPQEGLQTSLRALNQETTWLQPDDPRVQRARRLYDAGLAYADDVAGQLLDALGREGGLDRAAVVLLSDHGEAFGEHGRILHGSMPSLEMVHVPLIVVAPGLEPGVRADTVRTRDLPATLAELLDLPWEPRVATGRSFLAAPGLEADEGRGALSRSSGPTPIWALRTEAWTLVRHMATGREELYDRQADPLETRDLATRETAVRTRLAKALDRALSRERAIGRRFAAPQKVQAHEEALKDLGYL